MSSSWPFAQWGLDIVGPLKQSTGQKKNIIVACDYFTKWVKAEAVTEVTEKRVRGFLYNNILCRFGVPHTLVMDNDTQFNCKGIWDFCAKYGIKPCYASVAYLQSNGQVEAINKTLKDSIKTIINRLRSCLEFFGDTEQQNDHQQKNLHSDLPSDVRLYSP